MIKAVFFDLDDTLVPTTSADRKALECVKAELLMRYTNLSCKVLSVVGAFRDALRVSPWDPEGRVRKKRREKVDSDAWRQNLWLRSLQEHLGKNDKHRDASSLRRLAHECWSLWSSTRLENCRMSEKTVDALRLLREETSSIRLGIITNGSAAVQRQKIATCGVASLMDVVFIGDDAETCLKTKQAFRDDDAVACVTKGGDDCQGGPLYGEEKEDSVKAALEKAAAETAGLLGLGFPAQRAASSTTPIFIHRAKPCPSIFQAACSAVGCTPSEAVMVGDSLEVDARGAYCAGFAAAVLVMEGKDKEESQQKNAAFAQRHHENGNRKRSATDDEDGDNTTACCARDLKMNRNGNSSKIIFLQCSTVSQVPNLLREQRLLF